MRRGQYFFIALLSAALSFGLLTAFVNPRYSGMRYGCNPHGRWDGDYYNRYNPYWNDQPYAYPDSNHRYYQQPQNSQHQ